MDWNRFSFSFGVLVVFVSVRVISTEIALPVSDGGGGERKIPENGECKSENLEAGGGVGGGGGGAGKGRQTSGTGPATRRPRSSFLSSSRNCNNNNKSSSLNRYVIELEDIQTRISFPIAERPRRSFVFVCRACGIRFFHCVALLFAT